MLIDRAALSLPPGKLTLEGILRHELGHTLSYRHEHTRPEAGKCFEDADWKPLTSYDGFSVMHYPQMQWPRRLVPYADGQGQDGRRMLVRRSTGLHAGSGRVHEDLTPQPAYHISLLKLL